MEIKFDKSISKEETSKQMDAEIEGFSKYMESLPDIRATGALHPMERVLIKTFLIWKYKTITD